MKKAGFVSAVLLGLASVFASAPVSVDGFAERFDSLIAMGTPSNRISAADCGMVNGFATFNGWIGDVAEVQRERPPRLPDDDRAAPVSPAHLIFPHEADVG